MARPDPTGGGPAVALTIPSDDAAFLRSVFEMARDGIRDELADHAEEVSDPARLRREEGAYDALLEALDSGRLAVSADIRRVLSELAQMIDRENEYERVVAEHAALVNLIGQSIGGSGAGR